MLLIRSLAPSSADDACVPRQGRIVLSGPASQLRGDAAVVESYLT